MLIAGSDYYVIRISIHTPHTRSDGDFYNMGGLYPTFQSTLLIRGATYPRIEFTIEQHAISIHAPHTRSDERICFDLACNRVFQSTLLIRGATITSGPYPKSALISIHAPHTRSDPWSSPPLPLLPYNNFNPRSSYEERLQAKSYIKAGASISIHAPHTRSDTDWPVCAAKWADFNPRSSYEERQSIKRQRIYWQRFQSTLLIRGATLVFCCSPRTSNISIHAPHTRSDAVLSVGFLTCLGISIHAPHTRSDLRKAGFHRSVTISIHAPHTRSDWKRSIFGYQVTEFQSTLLIRGSTFSAFVLYPKHRISIHAPHTRSDEGKAKCFTTLYIFQSTLLIRGATCLLLHAGHVLNRISIHAPHTRSDQEWLYYTYICLFQSTLLIRGATVQGVLTGDDGEFQSTLLIRGATV